ncbi:hypothetical protein [Cloacibacillus sp.]|nr:hypothetical protein [Cloacibacillus sp.]
MARFPRQTEQHSFRLAAKAAAIHLPQRGRLKWQSQKLNRNLSLTPSKINRCLSLFPAHMKSASKNSHDSRKIGVKKHRMRHKPVSECPAAGASACRGNMDNLKVSPPCGGDIALQSPYEQYGSGTQGPAYLAYGTSSRRFSFWLEIDKSLFMFYHIEDKSAFRRVNNEITEGLASGGALKCGEHCQALGYEVSRAYKRRFKGDYISP